MKIDAHTHLGITPGSFNSESYEKNLDLILKEAKEWGVDALIVIAGFKKEDEFDLTTKNLIDLISNHKNVYVVAGVDINYEKEYLDQLEQWVKEKKSLG